MARPIVIIHGWSDSAAGFGRLFQWLGSKSNRPIATIHLADWLSLDDEVTYNDLREAMERAWTKKKLPRSRRSVDVVSHSTGALVLRDWMTTFFKPNTCPIRHHVMLAPANFGSYLADEGKAWYGRVFKGGDTGKHLLDGLELASPFTQSLADRDLFSSAKWHGPDRVLSTVLVGNSGLGGLSGITSEEGGDGTVRISTANLNAARLTLDLTGEEPRTEWKEMKDAAFGIIDGDNHRTITFGQRNRGGHLPKNKIVEELLLEALEVTDGAWNGFKQKLDSVTAAAIAARENDDDYYHQYDNIVTHVTDHLGNEVEDYVVDFLKAKNVKQRNSDANKTYDFRDFSNFFQRKVIRDVHAHSSGTSRRSFFIDVTTLRKRIEEQDMQSIFLNFDALPKFKSRAKLGYSDNEPFEIKCKGSSGLTTRKLFKGNRTLIFRVIFERKFRPTQGGNAVFDIR